MNSRLLKVVEELKKEGLNGLLISSKFNIRYLTGFHGDDAYLLVNDSSRPIYFTDFRYIEHAEKSLTDCSVVDIQGDFSKIISEAVNQPSLKRVGFEARILPFAEYDAIKNKLSGVEFIPVAGIVEQFRQIKDETEIKLIKKAAKIAEDALKYISKVKLVGKTEKALVDLLENRIRNQQAHSSAFEIIVASGSNSSFPHAQSSSNKIGKDLTVLVDIGAKYADYNSDLTRAFFSGKILTPKFKEIYSIVQEAKSLAINKIREDVPIAQIDAAARDFIAQKGYGEYFGHSLGHGIGLEVHEAPSISRTNKDILKAGMIFTVEPAIYLPGELGIRLEDMVLVTQKGVEILNDSLFN